MKRPQLLLLLHSVLVANVSKYYARAARLPQVKIARQSQTDVQRMI